jgi:hypothetical protein
VKLRGWLTTEPDGEVSLMPYAPVGATGTKKIKKYFNLYILGQQAR